MPSWIAKIAATTAWKRVPWKTVWTISLWLANKGRERVQDNLSEQEQSEFWALTKRSRGKPSNLSGRERGRLKDIVGKAIRGG